MRQGAINKALISILSRAKPLFARSGEVIVEKQIPIDQGLYGTGYSI